MHESTSLPRSATGAEEAHALLRDFRTDSRMLLLVALAVPVGVVSALVAKALLWLIAEITNLVFFQRFGPLLPPLENHHLGAWIIAAPVVGALLIGLIARYGSEKIRGHGIPEALEAILLGSSMVEPKVALLKPISSAISIGTGGPFGAEGPMIMTGGAIGSIFAQLFHLTAAERKTLLVAGAAAGMAAVFAATTPLPCYSPRLASGDPLLCSHQGTLLGNEAGELVGIITRDDAVRAFERSRDDTLTVLEAGQTDLVVAYPDESLYNVIAKFLRHDVGRLPVVDRADPKKVVGYLGRAGILHARQRYHREEDVRESGAAGTS